LKAACQGAKSLRGEGRRISRLRADISGDLE
jgi:hypothetical protein